MYDHFFVSTQCNAMAWPKARVFVYSVSKGDVGCAYYSVYVKTLRIDCKPLCTKVGEPQFTYLKSIYSQLLSVTRVSLKRIIKHIHCVHEKKYKPT